MNFTEKTAELGSGRKRLDLLIAPGIFEGSAYSKALVARLTADAEKEGPTQRIFEEYSIHVSTVLPPGYHSEDLNRKVLPDNGIYRSRIRSSYEALDADSTRVLIAHSWGAATCLSGSLWKPENGTGPPDLAILAAAAWSDHVGFASRISGLALALPLSQYPARILTRLIGCRSLMNSPLPEVRDLGRGMPDLFSSRQVAYHSYRRALEGPCLLSHDADSMRELLQEAGKKVTIIQGTRDFALNGPGILVALESIGALDKLAENARVLRKELDHWPLLEEPELLGEVLENGLTQASD